MKCKQCNKDFHACSNCDLSYMWQYEYCSEACWKQSTEHKKLRDAEELLLNNLDKKQLTALYTVFFDNECTYDFEKRVANIVKKSGT